MGILDNDSFLYFSTSCRRNLCQSMITTVRAKDHVFPCISSMYLIGLLMIRNVSAAEVGSGVLSLQNKIKFVIEYIHSKLGMRSLRSV